jgi:hypothetical protein
MKSIKTFVAVAALSLISFGSFAQSISATGSTLDRAEAKIAAQAAQQGASYKITSAQFDNRVHMTASPIVNVPGAALLVGRATRPSSEGSSLQGFTGSHQERHYAQNPWATIGFIHFLRDRPTTK